MEKSDKKPDKKPMSNNFIKTFIEEDIAQGLTDQIITRFPPEPNGYLHIGHAKAITLNFDIAEEFNGKTNLRFDDTNPVKEDEEYVEAIKEDVQWLGFQWDQLLWASDYFDYMYDKAVLLIKKGLAYVDELTGEEMRKYRGTLTEPGKNSPYRDRSVEENLDLFERMKAGEFEEGEKVLRAKIDMSSPNMNMRDPVIYRIIKAEHHNTGDKWVIYPMYDYAHPLEDAIEMITHSLCSLEFEDHRPFYDWVIKEAETEGKPRQIEFARLNITNTVMSKRLLKKLVDDQVVDGWDDPRMPTISGLRRRGYTPEAIKAFVRAIGISKTNSLVDENYLEHFIREDLIQKAPRLMAVLDPLKVIITNYPEGETEYLDVENNPDADVDMGSRKVPFSREIYIEREDFMEVPPPKYHRLSVGKEVRLKNAYFIKCEDVIKDKEGNITEIHCTYDPETKSGSGFTGRKVKGTIHWVDAGQSIPSEFRIFEPIYMDGSDEINPNSLTVMEGFIETIAGEAEPMDKFQFFRHGYFTLDSKLSQKDKPVFNRTVALKSSFKLPENI